jgi:hypothetical protein
VPGFSPGLLRRYKQAIESSLPVLPLLLPGADTNSIPDYLRSYVALRLEEHISEKTLAPLISALERLYLTQRQKHVAEVDENTRIDDAYPCL